MPLSVTFLGFFNIWICLTLLVILFLSLSIKIVPQNSVYVIERFGKYLKTMEAGFNLLIPAVDRVAYVRSLKEQAFDVVSQSAITRDNIAVVVDGVVYMKILDPIKASYGVDDHLSSVTLLAQTSMRSEIGKLELEKTFEDRESLNAAIVSAINEACFPWGVQVLRYEIKDINPPRTVLEAMERQMKAEREKRALILESEGLSLSEVTIAEGKKKARILAAEAEKLEQILRAEGEAQSIISVAQAKAEALIIVARSASTEDGQKAIQLDLAEKAIEARKAIAKKSSVILLSDQQSSVSYVVAEAMSIMTAMNLSSKVK